MHDQKDTSVIIDGLLEFLLVGGTIGAAILAPNALIALDKPLQAALSKLDARQRERELKRVLNYMKRKRLIASADYAHGIKITPYGKKRAKQSEFTNLEIPRPKHWDQCWRIVFFDIPESHRGSRITLTRKLRRLGFYQLQRSTWVHPFACRAEIEAVALTYKVQRYLTYIETSYIDNQGLLQKKFAGLLKKP
jgi:CRISPR/Cas system-associated endoribonuclease Cas2